MHSRENQQGQSAPSIQDWDYRPIRVVLRIYHYLENEIPYAINPKMSETRNPPSLKSARKTSTPIRTQTTVTGCGILVYFVSNSGSSICDFRDAFGIDFAVDLLLNATRETECANRFMLRSNDFAALAYFFEYPTLFFLDISSSSLPFIGTPSGTPQPVLQSAPAPSSDHKSAADAPD